MDAFCGFVRGIRGNQRSSVFFPSKCGLFPANFQPPLGGENFIWPAPLAEPRSEYISRLQNSGATFASCPFSDRGKSHSVRLRGALIQNSPQTTKKERLKNWFVSTKMLEAWLLVACCCCQGHATAPCEGRAVWFPEHQTVCRRCVSPRIRKSDFFTFGEENLRVSDCYKHGHQGSVENCKLWHRPNMNGGSAAR